MSISRTVTEVLREHVTLELEGIDRRYLNVYVPALQRAGGVGQFLPISSGPPVRLQCLDGPHHQNLHRSDGAVCQTTESTLGPVREGPAQGRCGRRLPKEVHCRGRRVVRRQIARENGGVPHGAAAQFRPPYGARNAAILQQLQAGGLRSITWNIDSMDWADPIPELIAMRVLHEIDQRHKGIISVSRHP